MSYKALINSNVQTAFNAAKDLAITAQFRKRLDATFNFNTGVIDSMSMQFVTAKIVVTKTIKPNPGSKTMKKHFMVNSNILGDVSNFDEVDFEGVRWTLSPPISSNGFIHILEAFREV